MYDDMNQLQETEQPMNSLHQSFETVHQHLLDRVRYLDLELRAVSTGLKSKLERISLIRDQLSKLVEHLPIGAILSHQDGRIQQANQVVKDICGIENLLVGGQSLERAWQRLRWPPVPFTSFLYQGRVLNCWEEVLGTPGTVPCMTVRFVIEDQMNAERIQGLQEHRMKVLGERVAKISHDLRNSLASVELFASLIDRRSCNDTEHQKIGSRLLQSVRLLVELVNNLSGSSKPRQAVLGTLNVHSLFDQVELLLTQPLRDRQICLKRTVSIDAEVIEGDGVLLQQACLNLVNNAIFASTHGETIEVECRRVPQQTLTKGQEQDGRTDILICVRDHGCGIKKENLSQICQPFFSTHNGRTGLGLSIVKDVMDAHQGTINVCSQEGQGTVVSLCFPQQRRSV